MKKIKLSVLAMIALALGITTSAFKATPSLAEEIKLHWFDGGQYLGYEFPSVMESGTCNGNSVYCADGYREITGGPDEEQPVIGTYEDTLLKS